jgi:endonuclease/exonuclease/phosphatase family metal-dependent hydrolase
MLALLTYNVHGCVGRDARYDPERTGRVIQRSGADVACLQDVEVNRAPLKARKWSVQHADVQPDVISQAAGLPYRAFNPCISGYQEEDPNFSRRGEVMVRDTEGKQACGSAILSRFQPLDVQMLFFDIKEVPSSETHFLLDENQQPRIAQAVLLDVTQSGPTQASAPPPSCAGYCVAPSPKNAAPIGSAAGVERPVWVVNAHLSAKYGSEEQRAQATQLMQWVENLINASKNVSPTPPAVILCGDFGSAPLTMRSGYSTISSDGRWRDLFREKGRCCGSHGFRYDHIFVYEGPGTARVECDGVRVFSGPPEEDAQASDRYAVLAEIRIA